MCLRKTLKEISLAAKRCPNVALTKTPHYITIAILLLHLKIVSLAWYNKEFLIAFILVRSCSRLKYDKTDTIQAIKRLECQRRFTFFLTQVCAESQVSWNNNQSPCVCWALVILLLSPFFLLVLPLIRCSVGHCHSPTQPRQDRRKKKPQLTTHSHPCQWSQTE